MGAIINLRFPHGSSPEFFTARGVCCASLGENVPFRVFPPVYDIRNTRGHDRYQSGRFGRQRNRYIFYDLTPPFSGSSATNTITKRVYWHLAIGNLICARNG